VSDQEYVIPDVDASVPTIDTFAGRWDRKLNSGMHRGIITRAEIKTSNSSKLMVQLTYLVDGDEKACPEGPVNVDQYVLLPPNAQFSFRNFREIFFPKPGPIGQAQVKALIGTQVQILTSRQEEKRDATDPRIIEKKAQNNVNKIVKVLQAAAPAEPDPFDAQ
jgi:hypothetical protein